MYGRMKIPMTDRLASFIRDSKMSPEQQAQIQEAITFYWSQLKANQKVGTPLQILMGLYEAMDEEYRDLPAHVTSRISCGQGCSHCCRQRVDISLVEAEAIKAYCQQEGIDIPYDYFQKPGKACGFLAPDGSCKVYPVRPVVCRKYFVVGKPKFCDTDRFPGRQVLTYINMNMEAMASALLMDYPELGPLPQMMLRIKEKVVEVK